jgi:hypothetical protein
VNIDAIHTRFRELIFSPGAHKRIGIKASKVRNYRYYLNQGQRISLELKIRLLQKAGVPVMDPEAEYTKEDLLDFARMVRKEAIEHDPAYAVDKFIIRKNLLKEQRENELQKALQPYIQPSLFIGATG